MTDPRWPIGCDRTNNHSIEGRDDMNILCFNGTVSAAKAGSPEWILAMQYTQDP